jgi:DeoR/GlpR family transcriptional regulator of sugar metabolism
MEIQRTMYKEQRIQRIIEDLEKTGIVTVQELKEEFQVSDMTIRRDLKTLEQRDLVERIYGGAILSKRSRNRIEPPIIERMSSMADEKKRIAEQVAKDIEDSETIFLGSGTTTLYVARELIIRDEITVVTNSVPILYELANNSRMNLINVGGFLRRSELSLIGAFTEAVLGDIRVTKVIMGMRGIHPIFGFTCEHPQELMTDRRIFMISDNVIIVADHTKIGQVVTNKVAPITSAKSIITSAQADMEVVEKIKELGVDVVIV